MSESLITFPRYIVENAVEAHRDCVHQRDEILEKVYEKIEMIYNTSATRFQKFRCKGDSRQWFINTHSCRFRPLCEDYYNYGLVTSEEFEILRRALFFSRYYELLSDCVSSGATEFQLTPSCARFVIKYQEVE